MNKKLATIVLCLTMIFGFAAGAYATYNVETIKAFLCYDVDVKLDGVSQEMYGASGERVYPIMYNGNTYVPLRAVSKMFDKQISWDGEKRIVYLGATGEAKDFIKDLTPYYTNSYLYKRVVDGEEELIAGEKYRTYIKNAYPSKHSGCYNLDANYSTLSFKAYATDNNSKIIFYGDNDVIIKTVTINAIDLPKTYSVNVKGVTKLTVELYGDNTFFFDAIIR